jgi:membrane AbrB-like protein
MATGLAPNAFTLQGRGAAQQWTALLLATLLCIALLELIHLPAALLVGAMLAAIGISLKGGGVKIPALPYSIAMGVVGCLVARAVNIDILMTLLRQWPLFLAVVAAVLLFSTALGILLARWRVLPGTTAVWGSTPGAAMAMTLMAEAFGGDVRLVAFMQFLRVVFVAIVASLVARLWMAPGAAVAHPIVWFPEVALGPFAQTLALATVGALIGELAKIPAGGFLLPLVAAAVLSGGHWITITLPPWLLAGCYTLLGWSIGLRFTRDVAAHVAQSFVQVAASIVVLIAACGALAYGLHVLLGIDPLTAYLATSPGGADSVAIIAAASKVDLPFVMAMQTGRFLIVLLLGPPLARLAARAVPR